MHTPGPWKLDGISGRGDTKWRVSYESGLRMSDQHYRAPWAATFRDEDTARLIAASPDLYEALKALVMIDDKDRRNGTNKYVKGSPVDAMWNAARAALAKVENA